MSRLQWAAAVLAVAVCLSIPATAHAAGTWPASVGLSTAAASQGDHVSFSGEGPNGLDSGSCIVLLDGRQLTAANCFWDKSGAISGSFDVPSDAAVGGSAVSVCWPGCYDDTVDDVFPNYWQANTNLEILPRLVEVPDAVCLPIEDAMARLNQAGFKVSVSGEVGAVVTDQKPRPLERAPQSVPVVLFLNGVSVPKVVGSIYEQARAVLEQVCLGISAVDGITKGTVTLQDPDVGARVVGGTSVLVTTSGPTTPSTSPGTTSPTTPGTTSPITPSITPDTSTPATSEATPPNRASSAVVSFRDVWVVTLVALTALWLLARVLARAVRRHGESVWVAKHLTVTPRPGPATRFEAQPVDTRDTDHIITVRPKHVQRSMIVKEDPP